MALKALLETLDGVDDAVKSFYVENDGKFVLDVDGVDSHPIVANLKSAFERTKADKATASQKATDLEKQLAEVMKGKPDEAALLKLRQDLESERDAARTEADTLRGQLTGVTRDRSLTDALTAANVTNPTFQKAAIAMLAGSVKMENGAAIVETDMGNVNLPDFIKRWAASDGKPFVTAPAGGGAKGGDGHNKGSTAGDMGGTKAERVAALKQRFPDLSAG